MEQCLGNLQATNAYYAEYDRYVMQIYRRKLLASAALLIVIRKKRQHYRRKRVWVTSFLRQRHEYGAFYTTLHQLELCDKMFINYTRLTKTQFEELSTLIAPMIQKLDFIREPIQPAERLLLTLSDHCYFLIREGFNCNCFDQRSQWSKEYPCIGMFTLYRYLASGDSMMSLMYQFHIAQPTISSIISETCQALWTILSPTVLIPPGHDEWKEIAEGFQTKCQFPNCIGAVDGKHVVMQAPSNSGSTYYNYKGSHSIVLMAVCDCQYRFRIVDIGAQGRLSDGGIWNNSEMGKKIARNEMNILPTDHLSFPYVFVGDEAFQLTNYMMRPYPGRGGLSHEKAIFNYRLSRARRMIENSFGILVAQWRIYRKPIIASVETVTKIVKATVCLHNFLRKDNDMNVYCPPNLVDVESVEGFVIPGPWRQAMGGSAVQNIQQMGSNNYTQHAANIRIRLTDYFNNEGAIDWQDEAIKRQ